MEKENVIFSKKKLIAIITASIIGIIVITVGVTLIIVNINNKDIEKSIEGNNMQGQYVTEEGYEQTNEEDYPDFQRTESWYNDPIASGGTITMPNLVGMDCSNLREYLDNNYLYFITDIKYKYKDTYDFGYLPTTILSTIPTAGEELDPYNNTQITVLADYLCYVDRAELRVSYDNFEIKNFGKKMKIQIGKETDSFIEGTIGNEFKEDDYHDNLLVYKKQPNSTTTTRWEQISKNKCARFSPNELTPPNDGELTWKIPGKIWIDNQLIKEATLEYRYGAIYLDNDKI